MGGSSLSCGRVSRPCVAQLQDCERFNYHFLRAPTHAAQQIYVSATSKGIFQELTQKRYVQLSRERENPGRRGGLWWRRNLTNCRNKLLQIENGNLLNWKSNQGKESSGESARSRLAVWKGKSEGKEIQKCVDRKDV